MIQADGGSVAVGADGTAAGAGDVEVTGHVLCGMSEMPLLRNRAKIWEGEERKGKERRRWRKERLRAAQQNSPQQLSPTAQYVSPQHVDSVGMQKGATLEDVGMQHSSVKSCQH